MSPTRRDIFEVDAVPSPILDPIHLVGMGTLWDVDKRVMHWPRYEVHVDDARGRLSCEEPV